MIVPGKLFLLSNQMMGTFRGTVLPSNIPPESLPDKFSKFFVSKIELIRSSLDPDKPFPCDTVEFSGTPFAEFKLITNDCVKEVLEKMPKKKSLVTLTLSRPLFFMIVWRRLLL